jgi:HlyD family secretion protein
VKQLAARITWTIGAAALAALLIYIFWPAPVVVPVARVERGPLVVTVDEDGRTRIKERYEVSSPLAGRLRRIELHEGDSVAAGKTLLATIEPSDPSLLDARARAEAVARVKASEAAVDQADSRLEMARAELTLTETELGRQRQLRQRNAVSQSELDEAESTYRASVEEMAVSRHAATIARFELEQAKAALIHTQESTGALELPNFEIRSPIRGKVLRVIQESAGVVQPGTKLIEVGDASDLEIEVDVLSTDAVRIVPGNRAIIEHWGGEKQLHGYVRRVEPSGFLKVSALGVEEQRVYVIIDVVEPPEARPTLGDAFRVEARIVEWESSDVLQVPLGALFRDGDQWAAFVVESGVARLTHLEIGHRNPLAAEVISGLKAGQEVVVHPGDNLRDGVGVRREKSTFQAMRDDVHE